MTLQQALSQARGKLAASGIEDASLEAELLLRHSLGMERVQLYLDIGRDLDPREEAAFSQLLGRRLKGEPSAYITGHREFFGLDFRVGPDVLIPRPETELLVEKAIQVARERSISRIAEIGTGCGAIAISLVLALPAVRLYATDISASALEVARLNCQKHKVMDKVQLLRGDMLEPLPEPVDLIVANLPYIGASELAASGLASFEPRLALDGGADGLDKIRRLCRQAGVKLRPRGILLLEVGQGQAMPLVTFLRGLFPKAQVEVFPDLGGIERMVRCLM